MISESERKKMLRVYGIGPRMVDYLQLIGIVRLSDLSGSSATMLQKRINNELGRYHISEMGRAALQELIDAANSETKS